MMSLKLPNKVEHESFEDLCHTLIPDVPARVVSMLENIHELRLFHEGDMVLQEGTASEGVLVLFSGLVSVSLQSPVGMTIKLWQIAAPAILGLSETMLGETFKTSVTCELPAQAVFLPARGFIAVMRQFPAVSIQFSGLVSQEPNATYARLAELRCPLPSHTR